MNAGITAGKIALGIAGGVVILVVGTAVLSVILMGVGMAIDESAYVKHKKRKMEEEPKPYWQL